MISSVPTQDAAMPPGIATMARDGSRGRNACTRFIEYQNACTKQIPAPVGARIPVVQESTLAVPCAKVARKEECQNSGFKGFKGLFWEF
jgi:hypothetical protein